MAQYDLLLTQNIGESALEFAEKYVNITKGSILTALSDRTPAVLSPGTNGYMLIRDDAEVTGLKWVAVSGGHTQNTDTGTTHSIFIIDTDGHKIELTAESASLFGIKVEGGATYADLKAKDLTLSGNLTVQGTTTTVNSVTYEVADKNIEIGKVDTPTDTTADGGGITLKGTTDKTIIWDSATTNWSLNQHVNIPSSKVYKINNVEVLSSTQVLGKTLGTMSEATATDYVAKAAYDANTILYATTDNTPIALTVGEKRLVGRKTGGTISALEGFEIMDIILVTPPASKTSAGTRNMLAFDDNFIYRCKTTGIEGSAAWTRGVMATNW